MRRVMCVSIATIGFTVFLAGCSEKLPEVNEGNCSYPTNGVVLEGYKQEAKDRFIQECEKNNFFGEGKRG